MKDALELDEAFIDKVISNPNLLFENSKQVTDIFSSLLSSLNINSKLIEKLDLSQIWSFVEKKLSVDISKFKDVVKAEEETERKIMDEINGHKKEKMLNKKRPSDKEIEEEEEESPSKLKETKAKKEKKNKKEEKKKDEFFDWKTYQKIGEEGLRPEDYIEQENDLGEEEEGDLEEEDEEINAKDINYEDFFGPAGDKKEEDDEDQLGDEEELEEGDEEENIFKKENQLLNSEKSSI